MPNLNRSLEPTELGSGPGDLTMVDRGISGLQNEARIKKKIRLSESKRERTLIKSLTLDMPRCSPSLMFRCRAEEGRDEPIWQGRAVHTYYIVHEFTLLRTIPLTAWRTVHPEPARGLCAITPAAHQSSFKSSTKENVAADPRVTPRQFLREIARSPRVSTGSVLVARGREITSWYS